MFALEDHRLNEEQIAAITHDGNVFLMACPGSGKTRALTFKIAKKLTELKSRKQFVVAITYTHRAADEIHDRIDRLGIETSQLWIGTIHSFCLQWILRPYGVYHPKLRHGFRVIDSHEKEELLTELTSQYEGISERDCEFYFEKDKCVLSCKSPHKHEYIRLVLREYFRRLHANRQIDFELILLYAERLLAKNPTISILLSKLFNYILIDEYQDTKAIQYDIVATILRAGKGATGVFIVGDPNQSIFTSLGGFAIDPAEFKALAEIDLKEFPLSRNYRSSERIIKYFENYAVAPAKINAESPQRSYPSIITYDTRTDRNQIEEELVRLIRYNIEVAGVPQHEICVIAPWWTHLASMTRKLMARLPQYEFDGPGMVPFARDIDNFWYKLSKLALTRPSPSLYVTRLRWAGEILAVFHEVGIDTSLWTRKSLLRECNSISITETDGLEYLRAFFGELMKRLGIDFTLNRYLLEHHDAFFASSLARIERLSREGSASIRDVEAFRKVFANRSGITISTIHGVKGGEFDVVIAYALLDEIVPHFSEPDGDVSANKSLYVICSRARKNLHLISETGRTRWHNGPEYLPTKQLAACAFSYDPLPGRST
jgi:DNA helicase II / ATP-dependent DNA helicase PcrA